MTKGNIIEAIRKAGAMLQTPPKSFLLEDKSENDLSALDFDMASMRSDTLAKWKAKTAHLFSPDQIDQNIKGTLELGFYGVKIVVRETVPNDTILLWKVGRTLDPMNRLPILFPKLIKVIKLEETDGT